ncbi:MAG: ABC transporter substrate-binding protein [Gammaproteobacteria bacterium]|nr:ABC transporter substrate-binding protein [Gammaproteobacteria bacterium]MDH4255644.1 ABC transporter substrate-binding protein [Gammaproteobacteria bacterium]MDH5310714.1 ABC transporter substrate-binding protein [Gammaproteobacteria bacterium]
MNKMHQWIVATLLVCTAFGAQAQSPNSVIEEAAGLLATTLDGRKDELAADREALYSVIDAILLPRFDRTYAAQLVLGRTWRDASEEQRERFIAAFYNSLLRKYADGLLQYDQNRIEILPFRGDETKPRVIVKTLVQLDDGTEVPVDYGLVRRDSAWLVFDVIIEGISYVRNFRAELDAEVAATSLEAVIQRLESENAAVPPG